MHLSDTQLARLGESGLQSFLLRAREHLARVNPDWGGDPLLLPDFVESGVRKAGALAIRSEADVICFLELLWRMGPARWSAEQGWIQEYLGEQRPAGERLEIVLERLQVQGRGPA
jgi:hypothetical protein